MSTTAARSPLHREPDAAGGRPPGVLTPTEIAWIALIPCAAVMLAAIVVLGPPLGHALFSPGSETLWPPGWWESQGVPEPTKQARYLLAVLAPVVLSGVVVLMARRELRLPPPATRALVTASQLGVLAFVVLAVLGQHNVVLNDRELPPVFGVRMLVAAAALVVVAIAALRRRRVAESVARLARETPRRRLAGIVLAAAFAMTWLLEAITTDRLVEDIGQFNWTLNDTFAVLDGLTPLVDYNPLYGKLFPYPTALALAVFGKTALVYTTTTMTLSVLTLLAVYAIFRRVTRSSLLALGLLVPFVALSDVDHTLIAPAMWPMRYGCAYFLAWLTVRHVDRERPRGAWVLFFVGGLITINNVEFGLGATLATLAALLCARTPASPRALARLAGEAAAGVLGAVALVALATLVRSGSLPDVGMLMEWPRIFTRLGLLSVPMPPASLHLAIYATCAATIAVAAARWARRADDVLLTSMVLWSGVFGLIAGSYYVGRSDDSKLVSMFSVWGFALAMLTIVSVRALAAREWRRPAMPQLLVLFGFALAILSIGWMRPLSYEIARLTRSTPPPRYRASVERFVRPLTRAGEKVAILVPEGHRIAYDLGLKNVSPFPLSNAIVTRAQLQTLYDVVRREGVTKIFVPWPGSLIAQEGDFATQQVEVLVRAGFEVGAVRRGKLIELRTGR